MRNDSACGSTIGPIMSAQCGVRTIDVGDCIVLLWSKDDLGKVLDAIEEAVRKRMDEKA